MFIVGLAGPPWSGKTSVVSNHLVARYGAWQFTSAWIWEMIDGLGMTRERANSSKLTTVLRQQLGNDYITRKMIRDFGTSGAALGIHDGIRWTDSVKAHADGPPFRLIYVTASQSTRFNRAISAGGKDGRKRISSIEQFIDEENLESEREIPELELIADAVISTENRTEDETRAAVDVLMDRWKAEGLVV